MTGNAAADHRTPGSPSGNSATSREIVRFCLSSRTRTTVPSRINRTIGSSASERPFQASQSPLALRQTRLSVSFPAAPPAACWSRQNRRRRLARRRVCCAVGDDALRRPGRRSPRHKSCVAPADVRDAGGGMTLALFANAPIAARSNPDPNGFHW